MNGVAFIPGSASTFAPEFNALFLSLVAFSVGLCLFLTILVIYYAVKYRRGSPATRQGRRARNAWLEAGWTSATLVVAFILFAWGASLYMQRFQWPSGAIHIIGVGKRWMWKFQHPGGQREINALHIPVGMPVVIELASEDVIHSFFVPAFRVKQDAVPGMSTNAWFEATAPGTYHLFCAEFCGTAHSGMTGWVTAMAPQAYAAWLNAQPELESPVAQGAALFRALGCSGCHENGTVRAPKLHGIYGHPVPLDNGQTVIADQRYIRDSILDPKKEVVAGYQPIMPSFAGFVDESELMALTAYIQSLAAEGSADDR